MRESSRPGRHEDERLSAFLDDELSDDEALEVARHLDRCERCLAELEAVRSTRSALRRLPNVEPPPALFLDAEWVAASGALGGRTWALRALTAGLVASAALAATAFAAGGTSDGTVAPPVEMYVVDHVLRVGGGPVITSVDLGSPGR